MRMIVFASRNLKEMLRDKLTIIFGLGFPLILLLLLSIIQRNIPIDIFEIENLAPGIAMFGLSFISLFSGMLIAKDRCSAFMLRLLISPMKSSEFIFGYILPFLLLSVLQISICFLASFLFGLEPSWNLLLAIIMLLPTAILFIAIGILCGIVLNEKQVGGICGALLTNLCGWLAGIWFDLSLVGGVFQKVAECFPFYHAVNASKYALIGDYTAIFPELIWVIGYGIAVTAIAIIVFGRKVRRNSF